MGLDLDDEDAGTGDDDHEVCLAFDFPDVVGDAQRMEHQPVLGVLAVTHGGVDGLLSRWRIVRAEGRNHSSHWPLRSSNGTRASFRETTSVKGETAKTLVARMPRKPAALTSRLRWPAASSSDRSA